MSDGGTGTFTMGMHFTDRFAGLSPMAHGFGKWLVDFLENFLNTPVYIIHGSKDQIMPVSSSRWVVAHLEDLGYDVTYSEHDEVHPQAGGHFFPEKELAPLVEWMDTKTRNPLPKRITYFRDGAHLGPMYWSEITKTDEIATIIFSPDPNDITDLMKQRKYAHFTAEIVGNRIYVFTKWVREYRLLLNDKLVDLSKPVEVITNDVLSFSGMVSQRSSEEILREARVRRDREMIFPAQVSVLVPPENPN
jgi:hypothetical protein